MSNSKRGMFLLGNEKAVRLTIKSIGSGWSLVDEMVSGLARSAVMFICFLCSFSASQVRLQRFAMFKFYFFLYVVEDERDEFCFSE